MEEHGLTPAALETQLKNFREGFPFLPVTRAASLTATVIRIAGLCRDQREQAACVTTVRRCFAGGEIRARFGAATRMFKDLFEFVREGRRTAVVGELLANRRRYFAFWPRLGRSSSDDADEARTVEKYRRRRAPLRGKPRRDWCRSTAMGMRCAKPVEKSIWSKGRSTPLRGGEVKEFTLPSSPGNI